ncbi:hypothetical protein K435DRAFT_843773 [Dendrothele bispora CBS 962.96]|uniref:Uncharacterized protein n=1 Tax=Dendrothele bispora (strain CBS 962.96) TaxID=1314807 RepID=A0A4S8L6E6_DENBC|nr:hypothetical protein K435DRAFT_843773 [Dendrothele bispora CBS 962.96]
MSQMTASFRMLFYGLIFLGVVPVLNTALQVPLSSPFSTNSAPLSAGLEGWDLDIGPNANATGHLVFETVNSLLQEWPNTRYRHGHNLIPGTVPPGTLLYHGRSNNKLPTTPEWLATDPEHSYMFCRTMPDGSGCWHLTVVTVRALKVLYFDGSSAAKMVDGSMDTQDVVAWGKVMPEKFPSEFERIRALCNWGKKFGIDGFVRMEMDFEIMLCDFTVGVEVESFLQLRSSSRRGPPKPPDAPPPGGPPGSPDDPPFSPYGPFHRLDFAPPPPFSDMSPEHPHGLPFLPGPPGTDTTFNEVLLSGSWHNRFPGEIRIKLDLTHLISFYDTSLVPSLVEVRFGKARLDHRVLGASEEDLARVMERLESVYRGSEMRTTSGSESGGVDWTTLFHVIVDRYANRLEMVRYLLNFTEIESSAAMVMGATSTTDEDEDDVYLARAKTVQTQLNAMLRPYILYSAVPSDSSKSKTWASPVYKLCATSHSRYISSSISMTPSENLLLSAIQETNREICRVITNMWVRGIVDGGLDKELSPHPRTGGTKTNKDHNEDDDDKGGGEENPNIPLKSLLTIWKTEITNLMSWLDWGVWLKCNPACSFEEMCYLPTWPFFGRGGGRDEGWKDPQPSCMKRIDRD